MNDPWLPLLYTSLELIKSSPVLPARSAYNVEELSYRLRSWTFGNDLYTVRT